MTSKQRLQTILTEFEQEPAGNGILDSEIQGKINRLEVVTLKIVFQLLATVNFLHTKNIVHRDIRLETIFVSPERYLDVQVHLLSFGRSVQLESKDDRIYQSLQGLHFCAPETFNEFAGHGLKVDEYAIGVLMYMLLSGLEYPFEIPR